MTHTIEVKKEITYDVIVCGGGPSGFTAALAARRQGCSVLLVDLTGQLGGMGTNGLVSHWLSGRSGDCKHWVIGGIFRRLSIEATRRGFALTPDLAHDGKLSPHGWCRSGKVTSGIPFDPDAMASFLDETMSEAGVDVVFFTSAVDVVVTDDRITQVIIHNKNGFAKVYARYVIDATGDADIAEFAGCPTILGRSQDHLMTPTTLEMHMENIDAQAFGDYQNERGGDVGAYDPQKQGDAIGAQNKQGHAYRFLNEIQALMETGEWPFLYNRLITVQMPSGDDVFQINTSRLVGYDGTDAWSVSQAMAQGRKESLMLQEIFRKHIPGFSNARIKAVASALGVRETRRIIGDFVLSMHDLVEEKDFEDIIGYSAGGWDLPDPHKPSLNPDDGKLAGARHRYFPIPYRIMLPHGVSNLICPGRAVSVERPILGPFRDQAPCMAMGEAAGTAVGLAIAHGDAPLATIEYEALRAEMARNGCIVDELAIPQNMVYD